MDFLTLAFVTGAALLAGFVDSIAGGGGLLALPALLLAGLDPVAALATNKLQGTFGTASATYAYWRKGHVELQASWKAVASTFVAAMLGVAAIHLAPTNLLKALLPIVLVLIALYFAFAPRLGAEAKTPRLSQNAMNFAVLPAIGFYDGIFGPGTGSFFMLALVTLGGSGLIAATGKTKLLNFTSNIAALIAFAFTGKIIWVVGLCMGVAQVIGAQAGAHMAMKNGARIIRPLLVVVCCAVAIKLLADPTNPIRALFP
jgi:uncharacterized membrane protein YfcA